jgi:hypothetical protein
VHALRLTFEFNSSISFCGPARRRSLALDVPMLMTLNAQETVALLSHELAHTVNGDPGRGLLIGGALESLQNWYQGLQGIVHSPLSVGLAFLLLIVFKVIAAVASAIVFAVYYVLALLTWRSHQRAE